MEEIYCADCKWVRWGEGDAGPTWVNQLQCWHPDRIHALDVSSCSGRKPGTYFLHFAESISEHNGNNDCKLFKKGSFLRRLITRIM